MLTKAVGKVKANGNAKALKEAKAKARKALADKQAELDRWNAIMKVKSNKEFAEAQAKRKAEESERLRQEQAYWAARKEAERQEAEQEAAKRAAKAEEEATRKEAERQAAIEAALPSSREKAETTQNFEDYFESLRAECWPREAQAHTTS